MQENSCGAEPFALRVIGDTMAPEFKDGCIIIVDPEGVVSDGCFVLAQHGDEYLLHGVGLFHRAGCCRHLQLEHQYHALRARE